MYVSQAPNPKKPVPVSFSEKITVSHVLKPPEKQGGGVVSFLVALFKGEWPASVGVPSLNEVALLP